MTAPDDQTHAQRGTRDTGEDLPQEGESGRPAGTVDPDANPPMSDPSKQDVYGGTGALPPQDTGQRDSPLRGAHDRRVPVRRRVGAGGGG